jgi:hypothetical protein
VRKEQSTTQDKKERKKLREIKTNSGPTQERPRPSKTNQDQSRSIKPNNAMERTGELVFQLVAARGH